MSTKDFRRV